MASIKGILTLTLLLGAMSLSGAAALAFSDNSAPDFARETIDGASNKEDAKKLAEAEKKRAEAETEISKLQALKLTSESAKKLLSARTKELESIRELYQEMHDLIQLELMPGFDGKSRKEADERLRNIGIELRCRELGIDPDTCTQGSQSSVVKGIGQSGSNGGSQNETTELSVQPKPVQEGKTVTNQKETSSKDRNEKSDSPAQGQPQSDPNKDKNAAAPPKTADKKLPLQAVEGKVLAQSSGNPLPGVTVQVRTGDGESIVGTAVTDSTGSYRVLLLQDGEYLLFFDCDCDVYKSLSTGKFSVAKNETQAIPDIFLEESRRPMLRVPSALRPSTVSKVAGGELVRVISGFEQSGASASRSKQNFFFDMFVTVPFPIQPLGSYDPVFGPKLRAWGDVRIASAPRDFSQPVREFAATFPQQVGNTKVSDIAQSSDFMAGAEYHLVSLPKLLPSFDQRSKQKFSLSVIASAGAITPLNPQDTISVFNASSAAIARFNLPATTKLIAFVSPDRDRFFRQYQAGFRLKTHYFSLIDKPLYRFPAMLDITYGINESVTRGRVRGGVLRLDAFYPLPWDSVKFIYLYGTAMLKPARAKITDPLILQAAPAGTPVPSPDTAIVTIPQIDRDYYRLGVGVDAISLFKTILDIHAVHVAEDRAKKDAENLANAQKAANLEKTNGNGSKN
jgi:hypothetical protein